MAERERIAEIAAAQPDPEATFTPSVSAESARIMAEGRRYEESGGADDTWTRHHLEARRRQMDQHRLRMLHAQSASRDETHTPRVSEESRKIMRLRRSRSVPPSRSVEAERGETPIHEALFAYAKVRRR